MTYVGQRVVDFGEVYDLPGTLGVLQRGHADPSLRVDEGGAWMCQRIYDSAGAELGSASYRFSQLSSSEVEVLVAADSAPALQAALQRTLPILGAEDDWTELELLLDALGDRISTTLAQVRRRRPGVRLPATGALFDQLVTVTLEQKVTHDQARYSWRNLLRRHGQAPPSSPEVPAPPWMRLPLSPAQLKAVPSWEWHRLWVQPPLSRTVLRLAERAGSIHRLSSATPVETDEVAELAVRLRAIPGVGDWTAAEALQRSHGAADLPAVGDFHLAHFVGEALTGRRTDDAGMLALLEPFRPHRQRVIRLLGLSGFRMSRYGPRLAPEDHRRR